MNNKIQILVDVVLVAAVAVLFGLYFSSQKPAAPEATPVPDGNLPIAYLNVDSLLTHYTLAQEAQEKLIKKQEEARLKLNTKANTLQNEMNDFQKKYQANAFLSMERAESEYQRLQKKQQELEQLEAQLSQEILLENQKLNMQLGDSLQEYLKIFNADQRFHVILSNTGKDNVLMAQDGYDITNQVVEGMNARYKSEK